MHCCPRNVPFYSMTPHTLAFIIDITKGIKDECGKTNKKKKNQDKNTTLTIITTYTALTTHIEGVFSIIFVPYLFMCATEGQAFDDLFVIIFISSQEKSEPTNQINTHTSLSRSIKGRAPRRGISYSTNRHVR